MKTTTSNRSLALLVGALAVAGMAAFVSIGLPVRSSDASSFAPTAAHFVGNTPQFEYARLVVTAAPQSTLVWINTPLGAASTKVGQGVDGTFDSILAAIRATTAEGGFDELAAGRPMDDMMLVQWMGNAHWEMVAVTQNQVDQGSTTSFFFKRTK